MKTILIVDDEKEILEVLDLIISDAGDFKVVCANGYDSALTILQDQKIDALKTIHDMVTNK